MDLLLARMQTKINKAHSKNMKLPDHITHTDIQDLLNGRHSNPFSILGVHKVNGESWLAALVPDAERLSAKFGSQSIEIPRFEGPIFIGAVPNSKYKHSLNATYANGSTWDFEDPYRFGSIIGEVDQYLFGEGTHRQLWLLLGAHVTSLEGVPGIHFAVWAPNAVRVSVVGDFNVWDGCRNPMRQVGSSGIWEIFIPELGDGTHYKYEIAPKHGVPFMKADPVGFGAQHPPQTSSIVRDISTYKWRDETWISKRQSKHYKNHPISIYEVHLGSWRRAEGNRKLTYKELAKELIEYVSWMGFTHIELMPITEYPFDGSWGYQPVGMFAPTTRFGTPNEFRALVEAAHEAGLGVILDWVPAHFPSDAHGLNYFDGTHLYEHADPREGFHKDWNTLIYNFGRTEVKNFLISNAVYWLKEYHLDGLRVDAVASMLYRDYSREAGEWIPNRDGGRENYEAIEFIKEMNTAVYGEINGVMTIAEESTAFPKVSTPVHIGGLGFGYKWNMGWMNDTLRYIVKDPIYRSYDHHLMTFPIDYSFAENFILPISHDEVVHGKGSMIEKMPGSEWEKFANLRAYYGFMWGHPGKKLLFMGCEFAQWGEWNHDQSLDWDALKGENHRGIQTLVRDLNHLYQNSPALYERDCDSNGFRWIANEPSLSLSAFARFGENGDEPIVVVCNFTPIERRWRIGFPNSGVWEEVLNTDSATYGGGNRGNLGSILTQPISWGDFNQSSEITLPPLSTVIFRYNKDKA